MNRKQEAAKKVYDVEKAKAVRAASKITGLSEDEIGRSLHWSVFKKSLKSAVAALIRFGMESVETRPTAHKIKNWEDSDPVFKYLLHARNAETHVDEHDDILPNPVANPELVVGGFFSIGEGGRVSFENCDFNGEDINGTFSVVNGKPKIVAKTRVPIEFAPLQILMEDVRDKNGRVYRFPFELVPNGMLPEVFSASHTLVKLNAWEKELIGDN